MSSNMMRYEINLKTFLFGGDAGGAYDNKNVDGWHCLQSGFEDAKYALENFSQFKETVENLLTMYGWDAEKGIAVDLPDNRPCVQVFEIPTQETMLSFYCQAKEGYL